MADPRKSSPVESEANEPEVLSNQTTFFEQELMEQTPPELPVEVDPQQAEKDLVRKKRKRVAILAGTGSIVVLLLLLAVVVLVMPEAQRMITVAPTPIPFGQQKTESALTKRLDEVEADLKASDPITLDVPFPPVNMTTLYVDAPLRQD
jgi:hypothetical protein